MKSLLYIFCCMAIIQSCKPSNSKIEIDGSIMSVICDYIDKNPQYNTLAIVYSNDIYELDNKPPAGFLLGPYNDIDITDKKSIGVKICNRMVYINSNFINMIFSNNIKWNNNNPKDSVYIYPSYKKYGWEYFIGKAWYLYYKKDDNSIVINTRPDTVFLPKVIVNHSIQFKPDKFVEE